MVTLVDTDNHNDVVACFKGLVELMSGGHGCGPAAMLLRDAQIVIRVALENEEACQSREHLGCLVCF